MNQPIDPISEGLAPPIPPVELRARALQVARTAMTENRRDDFWSRLWSSRPIRLAWASSVAVLIFGHVVIGIGTPPGTTHTIRPVMATAAMHDELAEIIDVRRLTIELPGWEVEDSWNHVETEQPTTEEDQP